MARPKSRDFAAEAAGVSPQIADPSEPARPSGSIRFQSVFSSSEGEEDETPESFLMDRMAMRPRSLSHHLRSTKIPSRRWLTIRARFWRALMAFGLKFHDWAPPKAPKPSFTRRIATDSDPIDLYFYLPHDYEDRKRSRPHYRFPIVVNFHGGGFCLGHATDDRYWARVVLKDTPAVFVSVGYRLAPEYPFPQGVDDCVEALLYLQMHADELRLNPAQIALSGFSSGGNLAFTVPFRLTYQYERQPGHESMAMPEKKSTANFVPAPVSRVTSSDPDESEMDHLTPATPLTNHNPATKAHSPWSSNLDLHKTNSKTNLLNLPGPRSKLLRTLTQQSGFSKHNDSELNLSSTPSNDSSDPTPRIRIVSIVAWYPLLDWTLSRAAKKRGSHNPKKTLPAVFTDLFDFSYLPAPDHEGHHCSPYASPSLAPDHMIIDGLPQRIQMWLCEWDMLLAEGERFAEKLLDLGKDVKTETIPSVPHGWDKSPNPFRNQKKIDVLYERSAGYLRGVFGEADRRATIGEGIGFGGLR